MARGFQTDPGCCPFSFRTALPVSLFSNGCSADQARIRRTGLLLAESIGVEQAPVPNLQIPDDGRGCGTATSSVGTLERAAGTGIQNPGRSAHYPPGQVFEENQC